MNASSHNLQVALQCQRAGLFVFVPGPDKKALVKWRKESTTDPDQIMKWFKKWPNAVPAIDLAKSGHIILDGDRHGGPDGVAAAEQLFAERSLDAAAIPTVITPQDGRHYWFTQPTEGEPLGNSNKSISDKGVDVRGAGGYVIAPGARLPDGKEYKRDPNTPSALEAVQTRTVPVLPPSIEKLLRGHSTAQMPPRNGTAHSPASSREERYAQATLNNIAHQIASTPKTGRKNELNNGAFTMGHMVAAGWIGRATVECRLLDAAITCGLVADDGQHSAHATIKSGLDAGEKEPHAPLPDRGDASTRAEPGDTNSFNGGDHKQTTEPQWNDSASIIPDLDDLGAGNALNWVNMSNWDNGPVPERRWAIRDYVPLHQAGLFSGEGGTGKSILELTKDVAHVIGKDWLNLMPEPGPAIYIGAEDSKEEVHIRLAAIAKHYGVSFKELIDGGLHVLCLLGEDATLVAANGRSGKIETTKLYRQIYEAAGDIKPKNISIDTLSRAFAGDEINRVQVYAFANYMQALAKVADGSVTILSHPSLAGMNNGSGISGSTAWHGAFRFRQYLTGAKAEPGEQPDSDLRQIEFKKNQYGPSGKNIVVRYQDGLFLLERGMSNLEKAAHEAEVDRVFIDLLKRFEAAGRNVSHNPSSPSNYAPKVFTKETEAKNMNKADLEASMRRLFANNKIVVKTYGKASNQHERIGVKNA